LTDCPAVHADASVTVRASVSTDAMPRGTSATVANTCEKIMRGRPREVTPDEVETRIADRAKEARERIIQHTREAGKQLATRRAALRAWLREEVAPRVFAEYERLEAEMLGAP
jgi:GrpB-like predicted nucleotidyltransferase (UPF0157 family)